MKDLAVRLRRFAREQGADLVGITPAERLDAALLPGYRAADQFPEVKSVVVLALHIPDASLEVMWQGISNYSYNMFGYAYLNRELDFLAYRVTRYLEDNGYLALPIPARGEHYWEKRKNYGPLSFRHAAVAAGLGTFGWQGLVLTPQFGARQRLITVLTDAELEPDKVLDQDPDRCRGCLACVKNCPAGAVKENEEWAVAIDGKKFIYGVVDCEACAWMAEGYSSKLWAGAPFQPQADVPQPAAADSRLMYDYKWHRRDPALTNSEHAEGNFGASFCGRCLSVCPLGRAAAKRRGNL
jgi:epoxyqueuosine reductase QueG